MAGIEHRLKRLEAGTASREYTMEELCRAMEHLDDKELDSIEGAVERIPDNVWPESSKELPWTAFTDEEATPLRG